MFCMLSCAMFAPRFRAVKKPYGASLRWFFNLHRQLSGFVQALRSFYPFHELFFNFSNLKGMICTPKLCSKNIGRRACSRPSYLFPWSIYWKKKYRVNRNARSLIRLITLLLCTVQDAQWITSIWAVIVLKREVIKRAKKPIQPKHIPVFVVWRDEK